MAQVRDVYATLKAIRYVPAGPVTHPFTVFIRFEDGTQSQDIDCRSLRDCLLVGNGMISALLALNARPAGNVVFDERFDRA